MRPPSDASHETMGEEGRLVATSSATYFQTKAGKSSQTPPTMRRRTLRAMVARQGRRRERRRRKTLLISARLGGVGLGGAAGSGMGAILGGSPEFVNRRMAEERGTREFTRMHANKWRTQRSKAAKEQRRRG